MPERAPADAAQRRRIVEELDVTLFVEAGAGSGKTRSLVDRIHALVTVAGVPLARIAAITFTDKAAAELRERVRRRLQAAGEGTGPDAERARGALDDLDGAAVSTLHAFAQRLLTDLPVLAGLPPRIEVADELTSQLAFEERWRGFLDDLLDDERLQAEPDDETALVVLLDGRRPLDALRDVALEFDRSWDLVAEHVHAQPAPPLHHPDAASLAEALDEVAAARHHAPPTDTLHQLLERLAGAAQDLRQATDLRAQLHALRTAAAAKPNRAGNKVAWRASPWQHDLDPLRAEVAAVADRCRAAEHEAVDACLRRLARRIADVTVAAAADRRAEGRLAFHDLLVLARALLRHPQHGPTARRVLHDRYTRLLIDEFQDTDPIQAEIALLLAADPDRPADDPGQAVPGRLFYVGDPKQSIYRFRRADIATFLRTRDQVPAEAVQLTANFRTTQPVVAWLNAAFERIIVEEPGHQPAFQPLDADRTTPLAGPAVATIGEAHEDRPSASELRAREVEGVVAAVRAATGGWEVEEPGGQVRPARFGDIAVLLPTRTVLDALEDGLEAAGIPYRTESSSLAYASREVRDLLLALRAVDDPSDELALVSALRSPLFGCSDVDLLRWRERGGRWSIVAAHLPERELDDPVHDGVTELASLAADRHWAAPAELVERLLRSRRAFELAGTGRRSRDVWRRLRYLLDQARAWREAGGGTLRAYLAWAYRQASDSIRTTEAVLPETDHDAVRIMTVHAAKGLEFPVVVVAGLTTQPRSTRRGVDVLWTPSGPELRLDDTYVTRDYETTRALDEQLDEHERRRLLYVACTRARDHLVVSLHRRAAGAGGQRSQRTLAELVAEACEGLALHEPLPQAQGPAAVEAPRPKGPAPFELSAWLAEHRDLLARSSRPSTVAATAVAHGVEEPRAADDPGLAKDGVDLDRPPWQKGRYGTAIGRAVHAVLQTVDLSTGEGLEQAAAAQAAAEGVLGRERTIAALARSALRSATVHDAVAASERWREVLVAAPVGDAVLEGYIDLLYRSDDGLVVVDYKTDQPADEADLAGRIERYRLQLAAYAVAVERVTGEPVHQAVLVFCSAAGSAQEVPVPDLRAAMAQVVERLHAATGGTPPRLLA